MATLELSRKHFDAGMLANSTFDCAMKVTASITTTTALSPKKNIPDIFDCNVKKDYWILIIFGTNIPETTCRQVTI